MATFFILPHFSLCIFDKPDYQSAASIQNFSRYIHKSMGVSFGIANLDAHQVEYPLQMQISDLIFGCGRFPFSRNHRSGERAHRSPTSVTSAPATRTHLARKGPPETSVRWEKIARSVRVAGALDRKS